VSEDNEPQNLQAELPAQEALSTFLRGMVDHMHTHQGLARTLATLMTARSGALTEGQSRPGGSRHRPDRPRSARRRRPRRCGCRCRHDGAARHQRGPRPPRLASRRRRLHHLGTGRATPAAPLVSSAGPSDSPKGTPGAAPRARSTIACGTVSRSPSATGTAQQTRTSAPQSVRQPLAIGTPPAVGSRPRCATRSCDYAPPDVRRTTPAANSW